MKKAYLIKTATFGVIVALLVLLYIGYRTDESLSLEDADTLPGMASADLQRIREKCNFPPPTDYEKAAEVVAQCETLWKELQQFGTTDDFRRRRFAEGTRYGDWKKRADQLLAALPSKDVIGNDVHVLPDWLIAVANDYAGRHSFGDCPSSTEEWFSNFHLPTARKAVRKNSPPFSQ